jgi:deoxyadenosine/deoxycytidine kinase
MEKNSFLDEAEKIKKRNREYEKLKKKNEYKKDLKKYNPGKL